MVEDEGWDVMHAIVHPMRKEILVNLYETPMHAAELSNKLDTPRATIAYHLGLLEKFKILDSKYVILTQPQSKGKAARVYSVNKEILRKYLNELDKRFCKQFQ